MFAPLSRSVFAVGLRFAIGAALLFLFVPTQAVETNCLVRDPSSMVKRGDTYWIYGTGAGTQQFSSKDRLHWTNRGPALPHAPAWLATLVPNNKQNLVWAPDIHFFHGKYFLYSSYSSWGSKVSAISVATSTTLEPNSWVDQGLVIHSGKDTTFNTIDPCIFADANGKPWLSFGSYFSGIKLIAIDPETGKQKGQNIYNIATRPGVPGNAIEASYIYYHDGYYYLFVNWDACCNGSRSTYNIRMGRSQSVTGPYLDKTGKDMNAGGGTLFLGAVYDNGNGRTPDDETGPGHVGILQEGSNFWLTTHYEWARDRKGATTVNVQKLAWDSDSWPRPVLDAGPFKITSFLATQEVLSAPGNARLQTQPYEAHKNQAWNLHYQGDGYYTITQADNLRALSITNVTQQSGKLTLQPLKAQENQCWYLQQNEDGSYTLLSKVNAKMLAIDIDDCSPNDNSPVQVWKSLGNDCQKWTFHRR